MSMTRKSFLKLVGMGAIAPALVPEAVFSSPGLETVKAGANKLKIRDIEIYPFDIPLKKPFTITLGTITHSNGVLIRILTDGGIVGIGESSPYLPVTGDTQETNLIAARILCGMLKGKDPLAIESAQKIFGGFFHSNPSLVAAFDMALYDIMGKAVGLPVFRLLGGDKTSFETDITTGIDTPQNMAANTKNHLDEGFKNFKIKVGLDPDQDVTRLKTIREAVGDEARIRIDANQGWTVPEAVNALKRMEPINIQFCEQPCLRSDFIGMRKVRDESPTAVMADESLFAPTDALKLIQGECCDYFNIKLMKSGGITNGLRIARIAETANILCMIGCMQETRIGLTASAHVHGASSNLVFADLDSHFVLAIDPVTDGMTVEKGVVTLPEKPGLGVDIDPAYLKTLKKFA